jgi:hypothetical protein
MIMVIIIVGGASDRGAAVGLNIAILWVRYSLLSNLENKSTQRLLAFF